ncbi:hypothetical protein LTR99_008735 [Exophiala xenobiotica]|uniref:Uncharacterized protein n=1 Tax=Vermiconidia calcicola TaxID=1690605 RepID=A0AAV9Q5E7_9PEZI|nr:hypothetical protein LTR41_008518 [Exophiala xenobiotica]KAK5533379.1 hypothetical protein LTR25_007245 [Vermiconidia calcicola]KAK5542841.1 hypothetical protein LTR23_005166 [Chaetothyriales sp. CCFEE 6169]KAK5217042.1 hypothetical protein LTR72_010038 [Exophiala xenobiotica]KAK5265598.1 hypothetical protein LTR96_009005 [Exophiala xenobiotica]
MTTRASIAYDNGHGSLDHRLIEEQHLPPHIRTTDQLADFVRSRGRGQDQDQDDSANDRSSISSSHYSTGSSTFISSADSTARYTTFSVPPNPYDELPRPGTSQSSYYAPPRPSAFPLHNGRVITSNPNPMIAGLGRRYVSTPVVRVLPGTTRKHPFQGYWVNRGTIRKVQETQTPESVNNSGKHKGRGKGKKTKSATEKYQYVETSGWYED